MTSPWPVRPLAECGRLLSGGTPSKANTVYWKGRIPWYSSKELKSFELHDSELHVSPEGATDGSNLVPPGTVLFVVRGMSLANEFRVSRTLVEATFNQDVKALIPAPDLDSRYLARCLRWLQPRVLSSTEESSHGTKRLPGQVFENLPVPVPPLAEQRRIADILDKADAIRRKRKEAIALTEELLRSAFLEMFGDPVTNPMGWPVKPLGALGRVTTGRTPPSAIDGMFGGPVPFVTPGDLESGEPARRTLTEAGARMSHSVRSGAALVCCIGATIGKMAKATERSAFNQQINAIDWGDSIDDDYGLAALRLLKKRIAASASSTTLPILNKSSFERIELPTPPMTMQRVYASRVTACEKASNVCTASAIEAAALFNSLVARAFSGGLDTSR